MKILYAIQATGNGHLIKAREIIPILEKYGKVDILTSGNMSDIDLGYPVKYKLNGISFVYNKKGGIDYFGMIKNIKIKKFLNEINNAPVKEYDLVINDYEPITAWACKIKKILSISISHQVCFSSKKTPRTKLKNLFAEFILKNYAPFSKNKIGFHFKSYDKFIQTPIIRKEIKKTTLSSAGHYTVYLPSYSSQFLLNLLSKIKNTHWHVFSRDVKTAFREGNVTLMPINLESFTNSFLRCEGILCGAGFETPSEALFMGKKLFVIPIKGQYEQECNAAALNEMNVRNMKELNEQSLEHIERWIVVDRKIQIRFSDNLEKTLDRVINKLIL